MGMSAGQLATFLVRLPFAVARGVHAIRVNLAVALVLHSMRFLLCQTPLPVVRWETLEFLGVLAIHANRGAPGLFRFRSRALGASSPRRLCRRFLAHCATALAIRVNRGVGLEDPLARSRCLRFLRLQRCCPPLFPPS